MSISKAGKKLGIKPSTAKLIVKKYRETGTFATRRVANMRETSSQEHQMSQNLPVSTVGSMD